MADDTEGETDGVVDVAEEHRFRYVETGHEAELVYRDGGGELILVHTGVPEALGGRGIGGRLVQAAVDRARETGETVVPWCPYARAWMEKHPDALGGVSVDWRPPPSSD